MVLTVHDECIAEVTAGSITEAEFLAILLEPPAWATGLPLAGKAWSGTHYLEPPEETPTPSDGNRPYEGAPETEPDKLIDDVSKIPPRTPPAEGDEAEFLPTSTIPSRRGSSWRASRSPTIVRRSAKKPNA